MAHNLTLTGTTFDTTGQKFGTAALSAGYGTVTGVTPATYPITIECWIYATAAQAPGATKLCVGADHFGGIAVNTSNQIQGSYGATVIASTFNPFNSAWHHVAMVLDASGGRLYVDGNRVATDPTLYTEDGGYPGAGRGLAVPDYLGYEGAATYRWPGKIDEVAVWSTAKYTGTTYTVPTSAYTGAESGLVALWHLDSNGNDSVGAGGTATTYTLTGPGSGSVGTASGAFTVTASGTLSAGVTITPSSGGGGGTFSPTTVTLATGTNTSATFTYTAASFGTKTISTTNSSTLTNPTALTYVAATAGYPSLTGATAFAFYDGSLLSGSNGSSVASVPDQSGNNRGLTAGTAPTLATNSQNGLNGITFAGTQNLDFAGAGVNGLVGDFTGYIVFKSAQWAAATMPMWMGNSASSTQNDQMWINTDNSVPSLQFVREGSTTSGATPANATGFSMSASALQMAVFRYKASTNTVDLWVNGGSKFTGTMIAAGATTWNLLRLGKSSTTAGVFGFSGTIYEMGVYAGAAADADMTGTLPNYLSPKWAGGSPTILPSDPGIFYSPYTWNSGKTIQSAAYLRTVFSGATVALTFNMSGIGTPLPQLNVQIDGQGWQVFTLAATITPVMPAATTGWQKHTLDLVVKSVSDGGAVSKWSPQNSAVILTGITLASGGAVFAPTLFGRRMLFYGDSITAGNLVNSTDADTGGTDGRNAWSFLAGRELGAEIGIIGMSAQGLTQGGQGGVPAVGAAYNLLWAGQARSFTPAPDLIVINHGTNDGGASSGTFQTALTSWLNALLAAVPTCPIALMRPFNGTHASDIQAVIAAIGNTRLKYVDTTGWQDATLSSDGLHPYGVANISALAPLAVAALRTIMDNAAIGYRGGFKRAA